MYCCVNNSSPYITITLLLLFTLTLFVKANQSIVCITIVIVKYKYLPVHRSSYTCIGNSIYDILLSMLRGGMV